MSQPVMGFKKLRDEFFAGRIPLGARLTQQRIASIYDASPVLTVVAFARLDASGFVPGAIGEGMRAINRGMVAQESTFREACHHSSDWEVEELRCLATQMQTAHKFGIQTFRKKNRSA